jgi:hypothetical protein
MLFPVALENAALCYHPPREEFKSSVKVAVVEPCAPARKHIWVLTRTRSKNQRNSEVPIRLE